MLSDAVQSRLLTIVAPLSPSRSTKRETWSRMRSTHAGHRLLGVHDPLAGFLGIADQSGGAADQQQGLVPGELQPARGEDLQQVADVQAGSRRVEADVEGEGPADRASRRRKASRSVACATSPRASRSSRTWVTAAPGSGVPDSCSSGGARVAAVGRDARLVGEPEPPGHVRCLRDADAWSAEHVTGDATSGPRWTPSSANRSVPRSSRVRPSACARLPGSAGQPVVGHERRPASAWRCRGRRRQRRRAPAPRPPARWVR